jgi:hypothetical protein
MERFKVNTHGVSPHRNKGYVYSDSFNKAIQQVLADLGFEDCKLSDGECPDFSITDENNTILYFEII